MQITPRLTFIHLLEKDRPQAVAWIKGNEDNSRLEIFFHLIRRRID